MLFVVVPVEFVVAIVTVAAAEVAAVDSECLDSTRVRFRSNSNSMPAMTEHVTCQWSKRVGFVCFWGVGIKGLLSFALQFGEGNYR